MAMSANPCSHTALNIFLLGCSRIGRLSEETCEESVADKCVLVSLMSAFGHGVGKECDIHVFSVFVFALIGESHDTVQERVRALIITVKYAFQWTAAAVTLHKDLKTFGQSGKVKRLFHLRKQLLKSFFVLLHVFADDRAAKDFSFAIHKITGGQADGRELITDRFGRANIRECHALFFQDLLCCRNHFFFICVIADSDDLASLLSPLLIQFFQLCHLTLAVNAPSGPDIDHSDLVAGEQFLGSDRISIQILCFKRYRCSILG